MSQLLINRLFVFGQGHYIIQFYVLRKRFCRIKIHFQRESHTDVINVTHLHGLVTMQYK